MFSKPRELKRHRQEENCDDEAETETEYETESDLEIKTESEEGTSENTEDQPSTSAASDDNSTPPPCPDSDLQQKIEFVGSPGINVDVPGTEPIDYFNLIANDEFYDLIVDQSNLHAAEILEQPQPESSRMTRHRNLTKESFRIWLGILFHTGTIKLNRLNDYWKKNYLFDMPAFSHFMPRDRFFMIMRTLHFNNGDYDDLSLEKINPLIDFFNERMEEIYGAERELAIDEPLVLCGGRLKIGHYKKCKKNKHRVRLYTLRESNGLILKTLVCGGFTDFEQAGENHKAKVVLKLMEEKTGLGHALYMNKYYNTISLVDNLLDLKTYVTGTLNMNRKHNPEETVKKKLKTGESIQQYMPSGIYINKWKNYNRQVLSISSEFDGQLVETVNRRGTSVMRPKMVVEHNRLNFGADLHKQMLEFYPYRDRSLRWYKKLGIHIFQAMLLNAYHLYNSQNRRMSLYDFRLKIIEKLLGPPSTSVSTSSSSSSVPCPSSSSSVPCPSQPVKSTHLPKYCEKTVAGRVNKRKCKYCFMVNKKRTDSLTFCPQCPKEPGLCLEPCFRLFHNYD